jgi:hypothetical protein
MMLMRVQGPPFIFQLSIYIAESWRIPLDWHERLNSCLRLLSEAPRFLFNSDEAMILFIWPTSVGIRKSSSFQGMRGFDVMLEIMKAWPPMHMNCFSGSFALCRYPYEELLMNPSLVGDPGHNSLFFSHNEALDIGYKEKALVAAHDFCLHYGEPLDVQTIATPPNLHHVILAPQSTRLVWETCGLYLRCLLREFCLLLPS